MNTRAKRATLAALFVGLPLTLGWLAFEIAANQIATGLNSTVSGWFSTLGHQVSGPDVPARGQPDAWTSEDYKLAGLAALEEQLIAAQVIDYYFHRGRLPSGIAEVKLPGRSWKTDYPFPREITKDPWGGLYRYLETAGGRFYIISGGPSKRADANLESDGKMLGSLPLGRATRVGGRIIFSADMRSLEEPSK